VASDVSFGKVAVLLGGTSAEREVSLASGNTVYEGLKQAGVDAIAFDPQAGELSELKTLGVNRVFNVLHGSPGEDGTVQGALEFMNIPYTGSSVLGSALAMDKVRCKQLFKAVGLPTAEFEVINDAAHRTGGESRLLERLGGTVFVKPANEGSSIGTSRADNPEQLKAAIDTALTFDHNVLVEAFIDGPEYTVAILGEKALPVIELRTPRTFYDYEAKYKSDSTQYICPCDLNEQQTEQVQAIALAAFKTVGASGWGRVDLMLGADGQFKLLEVNTVPGMTAKSLVPMAAKADGLSLEDLLLQILATSDKAAE
jgi:D-alanine-D-alanine ligase